VSTAVTINGTVYQQPDQGTPKPWGDVQATIIAALASTTLQKNGGTFTLTADAYFGATYGLKSQYYKGPTANPASAGVLRLSNTEAIKWRNAANSADVALSANAANELLFDAGSDSTQLIQSNGGDAVLGLRVNQSASNTWYFRNANASSDALKFDYSATTYAILSTIGDLTLAADATPSTTGTLRLGNTKTIGWRNAGNSADLLLAVNGSNQLTFNGSALAVGTGDVAGPGSSTDNAVARYDSTTGKIIQNSGVIVDDSDNISTQGVVTLSGSNLSKASAPTADTLYPNSMIKAWALLTIGAAGAVTVTEGFNVSTASYSSALLTVNFHTNLASANYVVVGNYNYTTANPKGPWFCPRTLAVSNFTCEVRSSSAGTSGDSFADGMILHVMVLGTQ